MAKACFKRNNFFIVALFTIVYLSIITHCDGKSFVWHWTYQMRNVAEITFVREKKKKERKAKNVAQKEWTLRERYHLGRL